MPSPDEVLEDDVEFRLERDDSDNDVYDDGRVRSRKPGHSVNYDDVKLTKRIKRRKPRRHDLEL